MPSGDNHYSGTCVLKLMFSCKFQCIDCVCILNIIQISVGLQISYPNAMISLHRVKAHEAKILFLKDEEHYRPNDYHEEKGDPKRW